MLAGRARESSRRLLLLYYQSYRTMFRGKAFRRLGELWYADMAHEMAFREYL